MSQIYRSIALGIFVAAAAMLLVGCAGKETETGVLNEISWQSSLQGAQESAKLGNKPVAVVFYVDWGEESASMRFKAESLRAMEVLKVAFEFVWVEVDGDVEKELVERYKVRGYPTLIVMEGDGSEIARVERYVDAKQTAAFLKTALERR